jgi:hypothetical protein
MIGQPNLDQKSGNQRMEEGTKEFRIPIRTVTVPLTGEMAMLFFTLYYINIPKTRQTMESLEKMQ